ncbi:MAG: PEP-CTERM sorting domain-containing protein [Burkholderiaceae bacterium]|nr:PEP-CTERM sorting domain-containing protein [Burkholderiaceae bacterium]
MNLLKPSPWRQALRGAVLAAALAGAGLGAQAVEQAPGTLQLAFSNIYSVGLSGDSDNTTWTAWLPTGATITRLSWQVTVEAFDPSWLQELTLALTNSAGEGVQFSPALDIAESGSHQSSGQIDLVNSGLSFAVGSDRRLHLEWYDAWDDLDGLPDGRWTQASLQIGYTAPVPEPASAALLLAGLLGVAGAASRRRRRD